MNFVYFLNGILGEFDNFGNKPQKKWKLKNNKLELTIS